MYARSPYDVSFCKKPPRGSGEIVGAAFGGPIVNVDRQQRAHTVRPYKFVSFRIIQGRPMAVPTESQSIRSPVNLCSCGTPRAAFPTKYSRILLKRSQQRAHTVRPYKFVSFCIIQGRPMAVPTESQAIRSPVILCSCGTPRAAFPTKYSRLYLMTVNARPYKASRRASGVASAGSSRFARKLADSVQSVNSAFAHRHIMTKQAVERPETHRLARS